jgi:TonB family protein
MSLHEPTAAQHRPARRGASLGLGSSLALSVGLHAGLAGCGLLVVLGHARQSPEEDSPTTAIYLARAPQDLSWYQAASQAPSESFAAAPRAEPLAKPHELELPIPPRAELVPQEVAEVPDRALEVEPALDDRPPAEIDWGRMGSESLADLRPQRVGNGSTGVGSVAGVGTSGAGSGGAGGTGAVGVRPGLGRGRGAGPDLHPGGGSGAAVSAATAPQGETRALALLESPRPPYPRISLRLGEEGTVTVRIHVDAEGRVSSVDVLQSSGFERLDEAACQGVRSWRFEPELRDGKAVPGTFDHRIIFVIEKPG